MSKSKKNDQQLNLEEKDLLASFERDEWKEGSDSKIEKAFAARAAENYFRKDARIN